MSKKSIENRLTVVERGLVTAKGVIKEIYIRHGVHIAVRAKIVGGLSFEGEPDEEFEPFRKRIRAMAVAEEASSLLKNAEAENFGILAGRCWAAR